MIRIQTTIHRPSQHENLQAPSRAVAIEHYDTQRPRGHGSRSVLPQSSRTAALGLMFLACVLLPSGTAGTALAYGKPTAAGQARAAAKQGLAKAAAKDTARPTTRGKSKAAAIAIAPVPMPALIGGRGKAQAACRGLITEPFERLVEREAQMLKSCAQKKPRRKKMTSASLRSCVDKIDGAGPPTAILGSYRIGATILQRCPNVNLSASALTRSLAWRRDPT